MPSTLFDKIWSQHVVRELGDGWALLAIDRHLLHDLSGPPALQAVRDRGLVVSNPELVFATPDHVVSSAPGRTGETFSRGAPLWRGLKALAEDAKIAMFDLGAPGQGIVHVMGPELGLVLPGATLICGDSHTCTNGALGALAFGVGTSESAQALATGVLRLQKPKSMRITIEGALGRGVAPKDVILHLVGLLGSAGALEHVVEFAGPAVREMSIEHRLTLCNPSVELGARSGLVAPDETTFAYLRGRKFAPDGAGFDAAVEVWRGLETDADARFDREVRLEAADVAPTITWGTSPQHAMAVDGLVPDPLAMEDLAQREGGVAALDYMDLRAGQKLLGVGVDLVFIGSCANSRISDLRAAAEIVRGRHVAQGVSALVVPGSELVKREAEAEGLDRIFLEAGFEWREPGCSMCVAANGDIAPPGARVISTSNRNFVGRQGPGARTHLASPAMAAAAAVSGAIVDVRSF